MAEICSHVLLQNAELYRDLVRYPAEWWSCRNSSRHSIRQLLSFDKFRYYAGHSQHTHLALKRISQERLDLRLKQFFRR